MVLCAYANNNRLKYSCEHTLVLVDGSTNKNAIAFGSNEAQIRWGSHGNF